MEDKDRGEMRDGRVGNGGGGRQGYEDGREVTQERGRRTGAEGLGTEDRGQRRGDRWEDRERRGWRGGRQRYKEGREVMQEMGRRTGN